jgi:outer membrane immunogenic protein
VTLNKITTCVAAIAALIAAPAFAADMAVKAPAPAPAPVTNWTGFYVGIDAGAVWWGSEQHYLGAGPPITGFEIDPINFGSSNQMGAVGGFLGGYNWQFSPAWVVGIEGDFNWASWSTNIQTTNITQFGKPVPESNIQMSQSLDWLTSVRGKLGYVWGPSLWYVTGGAAWEGVEYSGQFPTRSGALESTPNPVTKTNSGWVAGGGVEFMTTSHILLRLEYLYYGFKDTTAFALCTPFCGGVGAGSTYSWTNNNVQTVRAALSYKF